MWNLRLSTGIAGLLALMATAIPASADMGRAPVGEDGTYGSIEGGYLLQKSDDVIGYGIVGAGGAENDVTVSPDNGWFAGGMIGFANRDALISGLPFHRFEIYGLYGRTDDDVSSTVPPATGLQFQNVDGTVLGGGFTDATTTIERRTIEGGLRFEYDDPQHPASWSHTWVLNPFIRNSEEENTTSCSAACGAATRSGDVDTWMYGIGLAFEPEQWLTPEIALVGRLGAGIYGYHASGDFTSVSAVAPAFNANLSDDNSGVGVRVQLGAGLKFKVGEQANIETFAEADYFSDVGTAQMSNDAGVPTSTDTTDMWELRAGARLTFAFTSN